MQDPRQQLCKAPETRTAMPIGMPDVEVGVSIPSAAMRDIHSEAFESALQLPLPMPTASRQPLASIHLLVFAIAFKDGPPVSSYHHSSLATLRDISQASSRAVKAIFSTPLTSAMITYV